MSVYKDQIWIHYLAMLESDKLLHDPDAKKYELEEALKELKK